MKDFSKASDNRQSFFLALGNILALIAQFAIPIFLTRVLKKEEYGFYSQFNNVLYFLVTFFSFGIYSNLSYFFTNAAQNLKKVVVIQTAILLLLFSLLSSFFIFVPYISDFILGNDALKAYKFIFFFLTIIIVLTDIIHPLYVVKKDVSISIWFAPFQVVVKAVFIFVFYLIVSNLQSIIYSIVVSSIVILIIVIRYVFKSIKVFEGEKFTDKETFLRQIKYILPIGGGLSIKSFLNRFDKLLSISFLSEAAYASYSVAFFGIPGIQQVYSSISQITVINMTKNFESGEKEKVLSEYKEMVIKTLSFSVPIVLIFALFSKIILVYLFTDKYADATLLFRMHLLVIFFLMLGEGLIIRASGQTRLYLKAYLYFAPVVIPATYFLIIHFQSIGAMCGFLLAVILPRIYLIRKEMQLVKSSLRNFFPWKEIVLIFLFSILFLIPIFLLISIVNVNIITVFLASLMYLIVVYIVEIKMNIFVIDKLKLLQLRMKYFKY